MEELEKKIYDSLIKKMDVDESEIEGFTYDSPIFGSGAAGEVSMGLDSVDALELVVMIYDGWGIDVPTDDMKLLSTVNNIADYIRKHKGE
jgi:hypothetical protein